MFVRNAWYSAALCGDIKNELFARTMLNEKIVLYRTSDGKVAALEDRCIHRQVPLSKGRLRDDEVECWYHGMRFGTSGKCVHIPGQKSIPQRACVRAYPVAEKFGFVWLWMGDPEERDEALIPDHHVCTDAHLAGEMSYVHINTDYRLGVDNLLDLSHVAFVHLKTLASQAVAETLPHVEVKGDRVHVKRVLKKEKNSPLFAQIMKLDYIDRVQEAVYFPIANTRVETIAHAPDQPDGASLRIYTTTMFTPETALSSHAWVGMHRDFAIEDRRLTEHITREVINTILEDKDVTEHLQANWLDDAPTIHLTGDRGPLAARQIIDRMLKQEAKKLEAKKHDAPRLELPVVQPHGAAELT